MVFVMVGHGRWWFIIGSSPTLDLIFSKQLDRFLFILAHQITIMSAAAGEGGGEANENDDECRRELTICLASSLLFGNTTTLQ